MKIAIPDYLPAWLRWLLEQNSDEVARTRMLITAIVLFLASGFMLFTTLQSNERTIASFTEKCPFEAAGWQCSLPTDNRNVSTCFKGDAKTIYTTEGRVPIIASVGKNDA